MAMTPPSLRHGPIIAVDVRLDRDGYNLVLRSERGVSPVREGRRIRRWPDLDCALAFLVAHYGVLPIRLRLHGRKNQTKGC